MPTKVITSRVRPTYEEKPDIRYATSFLDTKYRDYAVKGEAVMDKTTGEIFMKRPADGRMISFEQNKKYLHDIVMELRVLLENNLSFEYPSESYSAYFLETHYDLTTINDECQTDLYATMFEPTEIRNTVDEGEEDSLLRHLEFNLSNQTNGFFMRVNSRDSDKVVIEYMTNQYNKAVDSYEGTNSALLAEKDKMDGIELWRDSNIQVDYTVSVSDAFEAHDYYRTTYIRYNESCSVYLPIAEMTSDFPYGWNEIKVHINQISYPKLRFVLQHQTFFDIDFEEQLLKLISPDRMIINQYCTIMSFVNKASDIELLGNENLVALLDGPYLKRYLYKMAKFFEHSCVVMRHTRPDDSVWHANGLWFEHVRDVTEGGQEYGFDTDTDFRRMERYFANTHQYRYSSILNLEEVPDHYWAEDITPVDDDEDDGN